MRALSPALRTVVDGGSGVRKPAYKIYAWSPDDLDMTTLVSAVGNWDPTLPTPVDLTAYATDITVTDKQLSFTMRDPAGLFHPDIGTYKNNLKDGALIRLAEGDELVDEPDWINSFTGQIHGQIGWKMDRGSGVLQARISVYGRGETQAYKRRSITTKKYTVGTDLGIMLSDVCTTFLGVTANETRIPTILGRQFQHTTNQLSQVTPWDGISTILEVVCAEPFFDGDGRMSMINKNLQREPDLVLDAGTRIFEYEIPERSGDVTNKVIVTFLDSILERVDSPYQKLGDAQVTTGFFSMEENLDCWWGEDHKQRADGTSMKVIKSVNSGILPVGEESYDQIDEYHGRVHVAISVWVPILATVMVAEYLAAAFIPDNSAPGQPVQTVPATGTGATVSPWPTIPWGKVLQAQASIAIMLIMMSIGSAQYEIWGTPYDMAYLEKQSIAIIDGLDYWDENEKEIENDFIGSHDQADTVAVANLIWENVLSAPRKLSIMDDPSLERGDIVVLPDGRQLVITAWSKRIKRGDIPILQIEGGKVLTA